MNKQSIKNRFCRTLSRSVALMAMLVSVATTGYAADDIGEANISLAFDKGSKAGEYEQIGFITDIVMSSDLNLLKKEGYRVVYTQSGVTPFAEIKNPTASSVSNTNGDQLYIGYLTTQESNSDIGTKLIFLSKEDNDIKTPTGYSAIKVLDGKANLINIDPGSYHWRYNSKLGICRLDSKTDRRGMAAPLVRKPSAVNGYPNYCNEARDDNDLVVYEGGQFWCSYRDQWRLDFCNAVTDPDKLNTTLEMKTGKGYVSFYKYLPTFRDDAASPNSSIAIVMHYTDPKTGATQSKLVYKHTDFNEVAAAKAGEWTEEKIDVMPVIGQVKVAHGMKMQGTHRSSYDSEWEEWRIYLLESSTEADNVSFTFYEEHDRVLQYRTFRMYTLDEKITDIDPYINVDATYDYIGSVVKTFVCSNTVVAKELWSVTDQKTLIKKCTSDEGTMASFVLPPTSRPTDYIAYMYVQASDDDTTQVKLKVPFTTPVFHTIENFKVSVDYQPDSTGIIHPVNKIHWTTPYAKAEDIVDTDIFMVMRASNSDFSDEVCIEQVDFNASGIYDVTDEIDAQCYSDTSALQPRPKVYYRVSRAFVYSNWNENDGGFSKSGSLELPWLLPHVTGVSYCKSDTSQFNNNHKVRIRVELDNPWNLVPAALQDSGYYYIYNRKLGMVLDCDTTNNRAYVRPMSISPKMHTVYRPLGIVHDGWYEVCSDGLWLTNGPENQFVYAQYANSQNRIKISPTDQRNEYNILMGSGWSLNADAGTKKLGFSTRNKDNWTFHAIDSIPASRQYVWDLNARILVHRYGTDVDGKPVNDVDKTITIDGSKVKWDADKQCFYAEVDDVQIYGYTYYYYKAEVDRDQSSYLTSEGAPVSTTIAEAKDCYTETMAVVSDLTATFGESARVDGICLEWEAEENTIESYTLERALHGTNDWSLIASTIDGNEQHYLDTDVLIGGVYDYRLTAQMTFRDRLYTKSYDVTGCRGYYGSISGMVSLTNGQRMPGKVMVTLTCLSGFSYKEVSGYRKAASVEKGDTVQFLTTDGAYHFENVLLPQNGSEYRVDVLYLADGNVNFINAAGQNGSFVVTLTKDATSYTGCNFTCKNTYRYSGRVLFEGSTIPVRDVNFLYNGTLMVGEDGSPVATDQKGNFSFIVPRAKASVQAVIEGHTFLGEGKIKNTANDTLFVPTQDLDGLRLWDQTRVRLVGRMVGGKKQGDLPMGFGLSRNNLGDNLKMVLEVEGDNTALVVYDDNNPDVISRDSLLFTQPVTSKGVTENLDSTVVNFQRRRIEIFPNVQTGEFCVDLYPVKYKISELSAKGYATLYNEGEGLEILDLSSSAKEQTSYTYNDGKTPLQSQYHATYSRIYHSPATVNFTQARYGLDQHYYGSEKMKALTLTGQTQKVNLATYDKKSGQVTYTFGHPVYCENESYTLKAHAYEKYYYNGMVNGARVDSCSLDNTATLIVRNSFVDSDNVVTLNLDKDGRGSFTFRPRNTSFSLTGDKALLTLSAQVKVNNYYYDAQGIQAYVTGSKSMGNDAVDIADGEIRLFDIVRDPYGTVSSAYRESGTKYTYKYKISATASFAPTFTRYKESGASTVYGTAVGAVTPAAFTGMYKQSKSIGAKVSSSYDFKVNVFSADIVRNVEYTMSLNEKVTTSSDTRFCGAKGDIYLGMIESYAIMRGQSIICFDDSTYNLMKTSIDARSTRIIASGNDASGQKYYLAIQETFDVGPSEPREFMYTGRHINEILIPDLWQQYKSMLLTGTHDEIQQLANQKGKVLWRLKEDKDISQLDSFEAVFPETGSSPKIAYSPENILGTIYRWMDVVRQNEEEKLKALSSGEPYHSYDISGGVNLNHTESASWIDTTRYRANIIGIDLNGGTVDPKLSAALTDWHNKRATGSQNVSGANADDGHYTTNAENNQNELEDWGFAIETPAYKWEWKMKPGIDISTNGSHDYSLVHTGASGYSLQESNEGYLQQDVYAVKAGHWNSVEQNDQDGQLEDDGINSAWNHLKSEYSAGTYDDSALKGYVFTVKAGAQRNPWYKPDSTLYYKPGTPLTKATLKIDNPRIYCDQPVVSNIPTDQKAAFRVRIANETELPAPNLTGLSASKFTFKLNPASNPNGAKVTYDGVPLIESVTIKVMPGQTYDAVIEVERVGDAYDFENLEVEVADGTATLSDCVKLSAHFAPTSSPVKLLQPASGWVMNTLSSHDENGYYIPVKISGFDVNYANFDHIELQYKKHTEGDDRWTTLRSFYCDQKLYEAATGNKEKFDGSTIEGIPFYGEMDPVEMQYDLRAITFCRLGTGYVTRSSDVISGTKDTRAPRVFGMPKPTNGILTFEDVISIPFNEPIAYNYLDETANFQVYGYTNDADEEYNTTLSFDSWKDDEIESQVTRSFTQSDFTLDMMVQSRVKGEYVPCIFFALSAYDNSDLFSGFNLSFGYNTPEYMSDLGDVLYLRVDTLWIASEPLSKYNLSISEALTHIGVSVHDGKPTFFVEDHELAATVYNLEYAGPTALSYNPSTPLTGKLSLGTLYEGEMTDVRIWNKALTITEFSKNKAKHLSSTTPGLSGHWPMNEAQGNTLYDIVNGADLTLGGQTWKQAKGQYSLRLDRQSLKLDEKQCYKFQRGDDDDYTLGLWYKIDSLYSAADEFTPLFQAGSSTNDSLGIQVGIRGNSLLLHSNCKEYVISSSQDPNDRQWHHLSISANKSHNLISLYRDGELTESLSGQAVSGIATNYVELGSTGLSAHFDCLTFWHMALPTNTIVRTYCYEPTGHEAEMAYYLPFEVSTSNEQGTLTSKFSLTNEIYEEGRDGKRLATKALYEPTEAEIEAMGDARVYCPLRTMTGLSNLKFNWTASDNELQINIEKADASINHQNLFVTVRNVEDLAGNLLENPTMLTVYVDRNVLKWDVREYSDTIPYGSSAEFQLKWTNVSGKRLNYTIQNYNAWLTCDEQMGVADPMGYGKVNFRVMEGLAPGNYSATVYLIDENKLTCPVDINIEVKAEEPAWKLVDAEEYKLQMNLIGKLYLSSDMSKAEAKTIDQDRRDIVAAFYEGNCVGRTYISADNAKYNVFMTIYGNTAMQPNKKGFAGADLEFRMWRASTGKIEILRDVVGEDGIVRFVPNSTVGTPAQPVVFFVTEKSIQALNLNKGWNWVSLYLDPSDTSSPNKLFLDNAPFSQNDRIKFNASCYSVFADKDTINEWSSTLVKGVNKMNIGRGRVYQIYMNQPGIAYVNGTTIPVGERVIKVKPKDWTEMAYMQKTDLSLQRALSDFQIGDKAAEGTIIKSYDQFAVASIDGTSMEWVGSLKYLHPGQGYYIYSTHTEEQTLHFVETQSAATAAAPTRASGDAEVAEHIASMPVVAAFAPQLEALPTDEVYAYVGDEVVGHAQLMDCGRIGQRYFLSVNAEQGDVVTFAQVRAGEVIGFCDAQITFDGNQVVGTLDQPLLLQAAAGMVHVAPNLFTQYVDFTICTPASLQTGEPIQISVFNAAGALVWQRELQASASGITCQRMDGSWLAPGVYVANVIAGGRSESVSLIRK